jgi:hypothetical protein
MIAGLAIWGLAFNALYGAQALGCALGWDRLSGGPASLHRVVLGGALAVFFLLHGLLILWLRRRRAVAATDGGERWVSKVALAVAWLGMAATLATGSPVLVLTSCAAGP